MSGFPCRFEPISDRPRKSVLSREDRLLKQPARDAAKGCGNGRIRSSSVQGSRRTGWTLARARLGSRRTRKESSMSEPLDVVMNDKTHRFRGDLGGETAFAEYVLHNAPWSCRTPSCPGVRGMAWARRSPRRRWLRPRPRPEGQPSCPSWPATSRNTRVAGPGAQGLPRGLGSRPSSLQRRLAAQDGLGLRRVLAALRSAGSAAAAASAAPCRSDAAHQHPLGRLIGERQDGAHPEEARPWASSRRMSPAGRRGGSG